MKSEVFGLTTSLFFDIYDDFRDELRVFPMYEKCLVAAVENSLFEYVLKPNVNGTLSMLVLPVVLAFYRKIFMHDANFHPKILQYVYADVWQSLQSWSSLFVSCCSRRSIRKLLVISGVLFPISCC